MANNYRIALALFFTAVSGCSSPDEQCWPALLAKHAGLNSAYYGVESDSARDVAEIASAKAELAAQLANCADEDKFYLPPAEAHLGPAMGMTLFDIAIMSDSAVQTARMAKRREIEKSKGRETDGIVSEETALNLAAFFESANSVRVLLELGYNPNAQDADLMTPLHHASAYSLSGLDVIRELVVGGADLEAESLRKVTPVASAYYRGDLAKAQCLVAAGADVPDVADLDVYSVPESRRDGVESVRQFLQSEERTVPGLVLERCTAEE